MSIVFTGLTFDNLAGFEPRKEIQTVNGVEFDFSDYPWLNHEQIGSFNYIRNIIMENPINSFERWQAEGPFIGYLHYLMAFTEYALSGLFETTPGYRTDYYRSPAYMLIKKMNTTMAEYGNESIEYTEWGRTTYPNYFWPNATDPNDLYMGGFRGPANIMWTGHFALMETFYERSFNTGEFYDEISWFINDWNNSLLTDGNGSLKEGGIWGIGLIPCEPYIVFTQCNSIAIYCTELYDNLYNTDFMGMWDIGLNFINTVMHDEYGLFIDGYFIQDPIYSNLEVKPYATLPGPALEVGFDDNRSRVLSYGTAWALTFLEYTQPEKSIQDYNLFLKRYGVEISGEKMYISGSFNHPGSFGSIQDMLGIMYGCVLAKQRGDFTTLLRIKNFLYQQFNKMWSANDREMFYDTSSLFNFLMPVLAVLEIWATIPNNIRDLADPRPTDFWNYPYISEADDQNIWVYQAQWDLDKTAFILNIKVDHTASLTFDNFDYIPKAYSGGSLIATLTPAGLDDYSLTLQPGVYNLVIL